MIYQVRLTDNAEADLGRASERVSGVCASACAYAFLGGVERTLDAQSQLGVHRFYREDAMAQPTEKLFTGEDLDITQRTMAALVVYVTSMGADARMLTLAASAGPDQMRWIDQEEARTLRVIYEPMAWKAWRIEAYRGGVIAISETNDGKKSMVASCTKRLGPQVVLTDANTDFDIAGWFEQNRTCPFDQTHPVFGAQVEPGRVQVIKRKEGGAIMRFRLPTGNPPLSSPALMDATSSAYPTACSTIAYQGSRRNFEAAVRVAFRNCFQD